MFYPTDGGVVVIIIDPVSSLSTGTLTTLAQWQPARASAPANRRRPSEPHLTDAPHANPQCFVSPSESNIANGHVTEQACSTEFALNGPLGEHCGDLQAGGGGTQIRTFFAIRCCLGWDFFSPVTETTHQRIPSLLAMALVTLQRAPVSNAASSASISISTSNTGEVSGPACLAGE